MTIIYKLKISLAETGSQETVTRTYVTIAIATLLLAAFLRFYKLSQIPPAINFDEASHALDAIDILNGQLTLFSSRLSQTVMGYMFLLAGVFRVFGVSPLAQRALTATFGLLLVPVSYGAVLVLFKSDLGPKVRWASLFTALLIASSFWAINLSRIGYEYILCPVLALSGTILFWRGYPAARWGWLFLGAVLIAAEFYIYDGSAPFMLVIPISVSLHALMLRLFPGSSPPEMPIQWKALIFFTLVIGLLDLPLFLKLIIGENPEVRRTLNLSLFSRSDGLADFGTRFIRSVAAYGGSFLALDSDRHWRSNLPGRPVLNPVLALFFVTGFLVSLKRIRRLPYLFLLVYWTLTLLPSILTFGASPLYSRMSGALPPTYMFIGLAWAETYDLLRRYLASLSGSIQRLSWLLALVPFLGATLVWLPLDTYHDYFITWANHPEVALTHDVPIIEFMERTERETRPDAIFILARNVQPNHEEVPRSNYTLDLLYQGTAPILYLFTDKLDFRRTLSTKLAGYRTVHLVTRLKGGDEYRHRNADREGLLPFLFEKYGQLIGVEKTEAYTLYTYRLVSNRVDFEAHLKDEVPPGLQPLSHMIGDETRLAGIQSFVTEDKLLVSLAWQPIRKVHLDYTKFVQLLDEQGHRITGIDVFPERAFSSLDSHEIMTETYTIPLLEEMRPGSYKLLVGLYFFSGDEVNHIGSVILDEPIILP